MIHSQIPGRETGSIIIIEKENSMPLEKQEHVMLIDMTNPKITNIQTRQEFNSNKATSFLSLRKIIANLERTQTNIPQHKN